MKLKNLSKHTKGRENSLLLRKRKQQTVYRKLRNVNMKACGDTPNSLNESLLFVCLFFFFNPIVMLELQMLAIIYLPIHQAWLMWDKPHAEYWHTFTVYLKTLTSKSKKIQMLISKTNAVYTKKYTKQCISLQITF